MKNFLSDKVFFKKSLNGTDGHLSCRLSVLGRFIGFRGECLEKNSEKLTLLSPSNRPRAFTGCLSIFARLFALLGHESV